jgi:hypothetical protein
MVQDRFKLARELRGVVRVASGAGVDEQSPAQRFLRSHDTQ